MITPNQGEPVGRTRTWNRNETHNTGLTEDHTSIRTTLDVDIVLLTQFATRGVIGELGALAQPRFQTECFEVRVSRELLGRVARWIPGVLECWGRRRDRDGGEDREQVKEGEIHLLQRFED